MAIQIDDNFMSDLGLANASDDQKQALMTQILQTLEMRVGTRLAEELSDEQIDEFERLAPAEDDAPEVVEQKQTQMTEWLKANHPNHEAVIAEELDTLKGELATSLRDVFDTEAH
ncbi:MAG TPA: DUF5663 domain-containing protein [Candidatus Saccharimonadales bacterium]|nr:DUF5663 domain-containing protein [Candidatus Saccharimonadales bacterium]